MLSGASAVPIVFLIFTVVSLTLSYRGRCCGVDDDGPTIGVCRLASDWLATGPELDPPIPREKITELPIPYL